MSMGGGGQREKKREKHNLVALKKTGAKEKRVPGKEKKTGTAEFSFTHADLPPIITQRKKEEEKPSPRKGAKTEEEVECGRTGKV